MAQIVLFEKRPTFMMGLHSVPIWQYITLSVTASEEQLGCPYTTAEASAGECWSARTHSVRDHCESSNLLYSTTLMFWVFCLCRGEVINGGFGLVLDGTNVSSLFA